VQLITKSGSTTPSENAQDRNDLRQHHDLIDICELEWNGALLTMTLNSGADICMYAFEPGPQDDILNNTP